jgi:hypothetical protein
LIRDLRPILASATPRQHKNIEKILPKGFMDDSYAKHEVITTILNQTDWVDKEWKKAQEYEKKHAYNREEFEKLMKEMGSKIAK